MIDSLLSEIVNRIKKAGNVKRIILFGSAARAETDKYSDLDLLIVKETKKRFVKRLIEFESFADLSIQVDIFIYTPEEFNYMLKVNNPFIESVLRDGKVIYDEEQS